MRQQLLQGMNDYNNNNNNDDDFKVICSITDSQSEKAEHYRKMMRMIA